MAARTRTDILIVSIGATTGWHTAARELQRALARAGAKVVTVDAGPVRDVRTFMLTDLVQATAARHACMLAIGKHRPDAIVYCSITAALLWPRPGAIWLDALAAENRPGRHGLWQRPLERHRLAGAPLLLTMAGDSLGPLGDRRHADAVIVPVPIERSGAVDGPRDVDVLAYAADPVKRRLDMILEAWRHARRGDETLVVAGVDRPPAGDIPGVRFAGTLGVDEFRALLRRTRAFVTAPRREDFGITALEALADGAMLVTTPAPGAYPALALARRLDARLVSDDLVAALRHALDDPSPGYAERAAELVAPFRRHAVAETLSAHVLPALLPGWRV